jgi:hypothetical protein
LAGYVGNSKAVHLDVDAITETKMAPPGPV